MKTHPKDNLHKKVSDSYVARSIETQLRQFDKKASQYLQ